jgi:hypothetical protein
VSARLEGWKQIADYLNRSERWCQRAVHRLDLPVWYIGGTPALTYEDADGWLESLRQHARRSGAPRQTAANAARRR